MISNRHIAAGVAAIMPMLAWSGGAEPGRDGTPGPRGFVRMVNAVTAGSGALEFMIDGEPVRSEGYQPGNVTGGIALKPAAYKVEFRRNGVTAGETLVNVVANQTLVLIPYAESVPATGHDAAHWTMRILRLKQHAADDKRTATFVSVAREPELKVELRQSNGQWEPVHVRRLGVARAAIRQARGYVHVRCKELELAPISVAATGNFVSVLYEDAGGVLRSAVYQDYQYQGPD
jgi:hypothetical protein